ncbi:MAG: hypothetical protein EA382_13595 [Spirochaetaceae bacterium]|nr:MAG: hypothetical protein EA382_13595 [Spirochaetaceae bacterium]
MIDRFPALQTLIVCLSSVVLLFAVTAVAIVPSLYRRSQPLDPYLTVVTPLSHDEAAALLAAAGVDHIVAPHTTKVLVSRFDGVDAVSLPAALTRLDPLDPRRDPFITALGLYFVIDGANALYARIPGTLWNANRFVRDVLGSGSRVAEWYAVPYALSVALFALVVGGTAVLYGRGRVVVLALAVPLVPVIATGSLAAAVAAAVTFASTAVGHRIDRDERARRSDVVALVSVRAVAMVAAVVGLSGVYVVAVAGGRALVAYLIGTSGAGAVLVLARSVAHLIAAARRHDDGHRPFVPVSILRSHRGLGGLERWLPALWTLLLVLPPIVDRLMPDAPVRRPVVEAAGAAGFDHEDLLRLWSDARFELPSIADYIAHRAYQEALAYGYAYAFPAPGTVVTLNRFREEADGSYSSFRETVATFDQSWIDHAIGSAPGGIVSMLASFGRPVGVVLTPTDALYSRYPHIVLHAMYILLTSLPLLILAPIRPLRYRFHSSLLDALRRRRLVA